MRHDLPMYLVSQTEHLTASPAELSRRSNSRWRQEDRACRGHECKGQVIRRQDCGESRILKDWAWQQRTDEDIWNRIKYKNRRHRKGQKRIE